MCNTVDVPVQFKAQNGNEVTVQPCDCEQLAEILSLNSPLANDTFQVTVCNVEGEELDSICLDQKSGNGQFATSESVYVVGDDIELYETVLPPDCEPSGDD